MLRALFLLLCATVCGVHGAPTYRLNKSNTKDLYAARVRALTARAASEKRNRPVWQPTGHGGQPKPHINFLAGKAKQEGGSSDSSSSGAKQDTPGAGGSTAHHTTSEEKLIQNLLAATEVLPDDFLGVKKLLLPNGITVLHLRETAAPTISVVFSYHAGSRNEEENNQGVAHLLEHMMFKGTTLRPVQWGRLFHVLGDQTNAFTTFGNTAYFHTVHKSALQGILELETDRMKNITLSEDQLLKEKNVVMSELTMSRNDAMTRLDEQVMKAAYPNDWPGRSIGGKSVMNLTREDAMRFYSAAYRPGCLTISVVGDIDWEVLVRHINQAGLARLGTTNMHEFAECTFDISTPMPVTDMPTFEPSASMANKVVMKEEEAEMAVLEYIVPLCNMTNLADVAALRVVEVLFNSVMTDLLRAVGVPVADSGAMADFEEDAGWMRVAVAVQDSSSFGDLVSADDALSGTGGLFEMFGADGENVMANPLDPTVVASVVAMVVESVRQDWFSDISSLAVHLAVDQTLTGDHLYTQKLLNTTKQVTVTDVVRVMKTYFVKDRLVVGTFSAGSMEEAAATVEAYGAVEVYTEHSSVDNTASYFKNLQCNIAPAQDVLEMVADLTYKDEFTANEAAVPTGLSIPIVPPLCFESDCPNPRSYQPSRPIYLKLTNGMELLAHEDTSFGSTDDTIIMGHIDAGMEYDPVGFEGVSLMLSLLMQLNVEMYTTATLMAAMMNSSMATGSVPEIVVAPQLEGMLISGQSDCGGIDLALEAIHHMLTNSVPLTPSEHQTMQSVVGDMVEAAKGDPSYIVRQIMLREIYPDNHPIVRSPSAESIDRIPVELVQKMYINRVCPENVRLSVVSGRFGASPVAAINKMADLFERWPRCGAPERQPTEAPRPQSTPQADDGEPAPGTAAALAALKLGQTRGMKAAMDLFKESPTEQAIVSAAKEAFGHAKEGGKIVKTALNRMAGKNDRLVLLEVEEMDGPGQPPVATPQMEGVAPAASAPGASAGSEPADMARQPTGAELRQKLVQVMSSSRLKSQMDKVIASGSDFLDHVFGDHPELDTLQESGSEPLEQPSLMSLLGGFDTPKAGSSTNGFGFLNQLSDFRKSINDKMSGSKGGKHGGLKTRLRASAPSFMTPLKAHSAGSSDQGPSHSEEEIPGLANRGHTLAGLGELGSLLALSWADVTAAVRAGTSQQATSKPTAVLGAAMNRIKGMIKKPAVEEMPLQEKLSTGLSKELNMMRGTVDRLSERLPPEVRSVFKDAHLPRLNNGISLAQFNDELKKALSELESKLPDEAAQGFEADVSNVAMQLESIKPQLRKIGHLPMALIQAEALQTGDVPDTASGGTVSSRGSNTQPEPTVGGALGLVTLPEIPPLPLYPPAKERDTVTWIKIKVPGLHEVETTMLTDTVTHGSPHYVPAVMSNHIVGGNSLAGKLGYWVRDCKGLTYHISSSLEVSRRSGLLEIHMQTQDGAALDQAVNDTLNILKDTQTNGFTGAELGAAKRNLLATGTMSAASSGLMVCQNIMMDTVYSKDVTEGAEDKNMWTSQTSQMMNINEQDMAKATKGIFNPVRFVILSMGANLEDTRLPNPNGTMEVYKPPPEDPPAGTTAGSGDGEGCKDKPPAEAGNPYRVGEITTYTPPTQKALAQRAKAEPARPARKADLSITSLQSHASPFVDKMAPSSVESEEVRLRRNLVSLERVGEKYFDFATGGGITKTNEAIGMAKKTWNTVKQSAQDPTNAMDTLANLADTTYKSIKPSLIGMDAD